MEWAVAALATAVALALHLVFVNHAGALWRDEINSVNTAQAPSLSELWRLSEFESFPAFWLLLLRGWIAIGGAADAALRVFGLLCGLAVPAAVWFAARRLNRAVPLVSLALLAVNPEVIRWSSTVRAWGLGAALAIVVLVLVRKASVSLSVPGVLVATAAAVLSVQCVYQNAVLLAAVILAGVVMALARRKWMRALVLCAIGTVAALSLYPYTEVLRRRGQWDAIARAPVTLVDFSVKAWDVLAASGSVVLLCWVATVALALTSGVLWLVSSKVGSDPRGRRGVVIYAATTLVLSTAALAALYLVLRYPTQPWYYAGLVAVVAVCAEAAIASFAAARTARMFVVAASFIVLITGFGPAWTRLHDPQTNMDAVAARLNTEAGAGDLIVTTPWFVAVSLTRYYTGATPVTTLPPIEDYLVHRYDLLRAQMVAADPMGPAFARIQQVLESGGQVWLVGGLEPLPPGASPPRLPPPPLPDSGWNAAPYERVWSLQARAFFERHVLEVSEIPIRATGGAFETASLAVLKGWRD
jgi:hypothetical protein